MTNRISTISIAINIWVLTALFTSLGIYAAFSLGEGPLPAYLLFFFFIGTCIFSIPALVVIVAVVGKLRDNNKSSLKKFSGLFRLLLAIAFLYGVALAVLNEVIGLLKEKTLESLWICLGVTILLFFMSALSVAIQWRKVSSYLDPYYGYYYTRTNFLNNFFFIHKTQHMETASLQPQQPAQTNRTMIKGFITGGLILLMMIPTLFITSLIKEREARQREVVREVSSKWAAAQTLSSPFLVVPYSVPTTDAAGKTTFAKSNLILLANETSVNGKIIPEERPRSIYKVLLYKSAIDFTGSFKVELPADIDSSKLDYANARLCFTLSDFKGIEEEIFVTLDQQKLLLMPGLPVTDFGRTGLSVPVKLNPAELSAGLPFDMKVKIKGSEQLHFTAMSASSKFMLQSSWPSPSFDGETLPNERSVSSAGFTSKWSFNQANLPFAAVIRENTVGERKLDFGVSLVQPADQYGKTMRSVKYAILFIGLTFAFFFIIELMQKKPFHPVQYVLVGIALVIFYTLLLSISEYIPFDQAYLVAAAATISLISLYAKSHFNSWKTAGVFFALLACLYAFIFVLIRLEDTALLVGSIGLFIVLALVMFASRRINWYGNNHQSNLQTAQNV
ncbi:MAG: cell envelope integrity protein CreD [Chitinophagaceae bacterium]|nr:MAG: cell envelope integrity protein CreD [Chitinophagaceae bacterium]